MFLHKIRVKRNLNAAFKGEHSQRGKCFHWLVDAAISRKVSPEISMPRIMAGSDEVPAILKSRHENQISLQTSIFPEPIFSNANDP